MEETLPIGNLEIKEERQVVDVGILHEVIGKTLLRSVALDIDNVHTEVIMAEYADKFMVVISQYPKLGPLFIVRRNYLNDVDNPQEREANYCIKVLFGVAGETQYAAARFIGEIIPVEKPIVLFLNLQSYETPMLRALRVLLEEFINHEFNEVHDESEYSDYDPENPCGVYLKNPQLYNWMKNTNGTNQQNADSPNTDPDESQ